MGTIVCTSEANPLFSALFRKTEPDNKYLLIFSELSKCLGRGADLKAW